MSPLCEGTRQRARSWGLGSMTTYPPRCHSDRELGDRGFEPSRAERRTLMAGIQEGFKPALQLASRIS